MDLALRTHQRFETWAKKLNADNALPIFVFATDKKGRPILLASADMTTEELREIVKGLAQIIDQGVGKVVRAGEAIQ